MELVIKIAIVCLIPIVYCTSQDDSVTHNYLDIDSPQFFTYTPSPLQRPESLKQRPYYDFLSTLYRHDKAKSNLFAPQANAFNSGRQFQQRNDNTNQQQHRLRKREVVFRPLFDYKEKKNQERKNEENDETYQQDEKLQDRNFFKREVVFRPLFVKNTNSRNKRENSLEPVDYNLLNSQQFDRNQNKRAIVFRPLFVYRQQQIKKYKLQNNSTNKIKINE